MIWLLLCMLPVAVFSVLDVLCGGKPPGVVRWVWRTLRCALGWTARWTSRWAPSRPSPPPSRRRWARWAPGRSDQPDGHSPNVFDTLRLQSRLGAVADEILRLESDRRVFAKAARLRATHRAYDDLLAEACRLANVAVSAGLSAERCPAGSVRGSDTARAQAELELAARGWSW